MYGLPVQLLSHQPHVQCPDPPPPGEPVENTVTTALGNSDPSLQNRSDNDGVHKTLPSHPATTEVIELVKIFAGNSFSDRMGCKVIVIFCILLLNTIHVSGHLVHISKDPQRSAGSHLPLFFVAVSPLSTYKDMGQ